MGAGGYEYGSEHGNAYKLSIDRVLTPSQQPEYRNERESSAGKVGDVGRLLPGLTRVYLAGGV